MSDDVTVAGVTSNPDNVWSVSLSDGTTMLCSKRPPRDETHVDALIADHEQRGDDPTHTARMKAMIDAVRAHEAVAPPHPIS